MRRKNRRVEKGRGVEEGRNGIVRPNSYSDIAIAIANSY